jgi:hypothetical protein
VSVAPTDPLFVLVCAGLGLGEGVGVAVGVTVGVAVAIGVAVGTLLADGLGLVAGDVQPLIDTARTRAPIKSKGNACLSGILTYRFIILVNEFIFFPPSFCPSRDSTPLA